MWSLLAKIVAGLCLGLSLGGIAAAASERPWNVVFFMVDDLGWADLSGYGSDYHQTPHVDRLAEEGLKFTRAYAATNCCSPTRGALMTGLYPARTHLTDWIPGWDAQSSNFKMLTPLWTKRLELKYTTLPEALRDVGYATYHIGKWHLGGKEHYPEHQGFDVNIGGTSVGGPRSYHFPYGGVAMEWDSVLTEKQRQGRYLTDRLADEAVELIHRSADRPFFLHFSFYAVHTPVLDQGKPELVEKYRQLPSDGRQRNPNYAAMMESMDEAVGRVRAELERSGVAERTIIVFTSDNGAVARDISSNVPLRGQKGQHWEGGERVPAVIYWPGMTEPGTVSDEPIITMDFYPTILAMTGVANEGNRGEGTDGLSLVPLVENPAARLDRDALYWHYPHYNVLIGVPYGTVRTREYKLIEYYEDDRVELYHLANDIGEKHDLAHENPILVERLRALLHNFRDRTGAQMPIPNPQYDPSDPKVVRFYSLMATEMGDPESSYEGQLTEASRSLVP